MRILIATLVLTLLVVPFASGEVYSNMVGLYKIDLVMGRNLVSMPFLPFNSPLDEVIGGQLTGHPVSQWASDRINRWDPALQTYEMAWYSTSLTKWVAWNTASGDPTFDFNPDESYWITIINVSKTLVLLGEVSESDRIMALVVGRNFVAPSFPKEVSLDDAGLLPGFTGHPVSQWASDKIEFWNEVAQTYVGVWYRTGQGWRQWDTMDTPPVNPYDRIVPGRGMWIKVINTSFTWTSPKPY